MIFNKKLICMLLASASTVVANASLRARELTAPDPNCSTKAKCYLVNLETKAETLLDETKPTVYDPTSSFNGFSLKCDVTGGETNYVKWYFNGKVNTHYDAPWWMNGDNSQTRVNDEIFLEKCGTKHIDITYFTWKGGDEYPCFSKGYDLTAACKGTKAPVTAMPTPAPSKAPTMAPTVAPTKAPTVAPTASPTKAPVVPPPPKITSCTRLGWGLQYQPAVPKGVKLEAKSPIDGSIYHFTSTGGTSIAIPRGTKDFVAFFTSFYRQGFQLRFVMNGVPGPYTLCHKNTPLGIDIDESGAVERIQGEFKIDITGDGNMEILHEWFAPTEGILINMMPFIKDGKVTGENLFGDMGRQYQDGYEKLALLDHDFDQILRGTELDGLAIWTDANSNARLDDGELSTLASHDIVGLRTDNDANYASSAVLKDGSEMYMEDLWFAR